MPAAHALSDAFYSHRAFVPHLILGRLGIRRYWVCNTLFTLGCALALLLCAALDDALILGSGKYGFLQHPGIFGWLLIQLALPLVIHTALRRAIWAGESYRKLSRAGESIEFQRRLYVPLLQFIGFKTGISRATFALLFTIGFAGFAWNTYNNIHPTDIPIQSFWDSVYFRWGYFGSRLYKFYIDALLLPSIIHIFAGIAWSNISYLRSLSEEKRVKLIPFSPDGCGGMAFVVELILSPVITAMLTSGVAFLGVVYTHRVFDLTVSMGTLVELGIFLSFYVLPTAFIRRIIKNLKSIETNEIYRRQQIFYEQIIERGLTGKVLKDAKEHSDYFQFAADKVKRVPNWPHLSRTLGALGVSITPALFVSTMSLASQWARVFLDQTQ